MFKYFVILFVIGMNNGDVGEAASPPNIVIIMPDDLGWNDNGFHGSNQIQTPCLDALAYDGIILNRHYVAPMCTPSRSSLMTGLNPIHTGMQHYVIVSDQPYGLDLNQKIMPQYFQEAGYDTHLIGKWHLGFFKKEYTPTQRGFTTHKGYWGPYIDYESFGLVMEGRYPEGYDMRNNMNVSYEPKGQYITDYFNNESVNIIKSHNTSKPLFLMLNHLAPHSGNEKKPLSAPKDTVEKFSYIKDPLRQVYSAMVSKIDDGVCDVFKALKEKKMLDNTIILYYSDNGAPTEGLHSNRGSNYPLRGQKDSPWEGAARSPSFVWSPLIKNRRRVSNQYFHVADWLPTLAHSAGINLPKTPYPIDGQNLWEALLNEAVNPRNEVLINIDDEEGYSSYIQNNFKYINGTTLEGAFDGWLGDFEKFGSISNEEYMSRLMGTNIAKHLNLSTTTVNRLRTQATVRCTRSVNETKCDPKISECLFNIESDPCEYNNLAFSRPELLLQLRNKVNSYRSSAVPLRNKPSDPNANPAFYNYTWTNWQDQEISKRTSTIIKVTVIAIIICVTIIIIMGSLFYLSNKSFRQLQHAILKRKQSVRPEQVNGGNHNQNNNSTETKPYPNIQFISDNH